MCTGPDTNEVPVSPIDLVVLALFSRRRMIGRFICWSTMCCSQVLGEKEHIRAEVFGRQTPKRAFCKAIPECGPLLDRKLIERQMVGAKRKRLGQFRFPIFQALILARIDQIEAHSTEQ